MRRNGSAVDARLTNASTRLHRSIYSRIGKRLVDVIVGMGCLVMVFPLTMIIAMAVKFSSRGPIVFRQARLGRDARVFEAIKFRTMTHKNRVPDTEYFKGDPSEITPVGRLLRRWKLDELPQLYNVIRGEMSIVGPRPQLPVQLEEFNDDARLRLLVRPGLTGLAQVNGNTKLTWPERWYYDAQYAESLSLILDVTIVVRTIGVIVMGEDRFLRRPSAERNQE